MKKLYEVRFVSGLKIEINLNWYELKKLIRKYKVNGIKNIA